jgi:hypothetical protein
MFSYVVYWPVPASLAGPYVKIISGDTLEDTFKQAMRWQAENLTLEQHLSGGIKYLGIAPDTP